MGGGFTRSVAEGQGLSDWFFTRSVAESHGFFSLSRIVGFFFFLHTESRGRSRIIELSNYYFQSHGESRKVTDFLCPEFSNYRINTFKSHGESQKVTDYRIIFTRNVAEDHGFFFTLNVGSAEGWVTRRGGVGACFCM